MDNCNIEYARRYLHVLHHQWAKSQVERLLAEGVLFTLPLHLTDDGSCIWYIIGLIRLKTCTGVALCLACSRLFLTYRLLSFHFTHLRICTNYILNIKMLTHFGYPPVLILNRRSVTAAAVAAKKQSIVANGAALLVRLLIWPMLIWHRKH